MHVLIHADYNAKLAVLSQCDEHCILVQIGNYIQHKGGVVTAEELAPYLDVPPAGKDAESIVVDESYVVPALVRFGGSPEVDKNNNLIYRFPSLQKTGRRQVSSSAPAVVAKLCCIMKMLNGQATCRGILISPSRLLSVVDVCMYVCMYFFNVYRHCCTRLGQAMWSTAWS